MMTIRDVCVFACGAVLASLQVSACGKEERPERAEVLAEERENEIPDGRLPTPTEDYQSRACWFDEISGFAEECGVVTLPESPGSDSVVELGVARIFNAEETPKGPPVVYLDGGPGGSIIDNLDVIFTAFSPLAKDRDVIFIDQRGTGVSKPNLSCTEDGETGPALDECYARIEETTDPAAYTTAANARDFDLVRKALGYDEWSLLGISYGTRLGLTILRDYPEGVHSAVLDAVVPFEVDMLANLGKNGQQAFDLVFEACAADEDCNAAYPDSRAQFIEVVAKLDETPETFGEYELTGADFVSVLFNLTYSPVVLVYVPMIIDDAANGNFDIFSELGSQVGGSDFSFGMHLSVQCAEEMSFTSLEIIDQVDAEFVEPELIGGLTGRDYAEYCEHWPVPGAPASENEAVTSKVPTLLFSGAFDPITPPSYAALVDESLDDSRAVVVTNESHGASLSDCGLSIVRGFLADPAADLSTACLDELPTPDFQDIGEETGVRSVGGRLRLATERPTDEELEEAKEDLRRRVLL